MEMELFLTFHHLDAILASKNSKNYWLLTPGADPDIPDKVGCRSVAPSEGTGNLRPASPSAMSDSFTPCPEESTQTARVTHISVSTITKQPRNRASKQQTQRIQIAANFDLSKIS